VAGTDPDVVFICVSKFANLCRPCSTGADCKSVGGVDDVCLDYGSDGDFCGGVCTENDDCPWGFSCTDGKTVEGADVKQCVADTGTCPCTAKSVALAATTTCEVVNEFGECPGTRTCTVEGLTACSAAEPAAESCNGIDDDCDGDVDEPALVEGKLLELCDDNNDCTEDSCTGTEGCKNTTLDSGSCDDDNPCTIADHCVQGTCTGTPVECHDDNPCTDDVCTATGGCEFPVNAATCDDGTPCTLADQCVEGVCKGIEMPCECQVDGDCAALEDGDLCNGTLVCDTGSLPYECVVDPANVVVCPAPQGENAFCLQAACDPGTGTCSFIPNHEGFLCDNGDACTVNDKCIEGVCTGGVAVNCNDGNPCTDDACVPESGCTHEANTAACTDGDACTVGDHCAEGQCVGGAALPCDDNDVCNGVEICDVVKGCISGTPVACNDGEACNGIEMCDPALGCLPGKPVVCNDSNPCAADSCMGGVCTFEPLAGACDDGNACTTGDHCDGGSCVYDGLLDCSDGNVCTTDFCDPVKGCKAVANDAPCDDGNVCTVGDHCKSGGCTASGNLKCDDSDACTDDFCDPVAGCDFVPNGGTCEDGNVCTDDFCDPAKGCLHTPTDISCDDGNACTAGDFCSGGDCVSGVPLDCDDGDPCSVDSCSPETGCKNVALVPCCGDGLCEVGEGCGCPSDCSAPEVCDGKDNDCDGEVDNGFEQDDCKTSCKFTWTGNGAELNCCGDDTLEGKPYAVKEDGLCDGLDNDCDGKVDEGCWKDETVVSAPLGYAVNQMAAIALDGVGDPVVVWGARKELLTESNDIYFSRKAGGSWTFPAKLSESNANNVHPTVAAAPGGKVFVAWTQETGTAPAQHSIIVKTNEGDYWSQVGYFWSPVSHAQFPALVTDGVGRIHLIWDVQTQVLYSSYEGGLWSEPFTVGAGPGKNSERGTAIAATGDSGVHVVWKGSAAGGNDIFYRRLMNGSWSDPANLSSNGGSSSRPDVAAGPGTVSAVWYDNSLDPKGANYEILLRASTDSGKTWGAPANISDSPKPSLSPSIAIGPSLKPHVVWKDEGLGGGAPYRPELGPIVQSCGGDYPDIAVDGTGDAHIVGAGGGGSMVIYCKYLCCP
jgi:hypothetical protein